MNRARAPLLADTWAELRRRKVIRALIPYALCAWIVLQLAEITYDPLGLPPIALTWTVLVAILGFPVVAGIAWFFDVTGGGIARDRSALASRAAGPLFALVVLLLTVLGIGWWLSTVYVPESAQDAVADGAAPPNSVAVLPFDDLSPGGDRGYFADGIAEELIDRLAAVSGLRVAARTSSFAFRGQETDIREIGRVLDVAFVLEGSVRLAEGRVRVTAQLIDARDGFHAWSQTYERPDADVFALQDEITTAIVAQLRERIAGVGEAGSAQTGTDDPEALALYLQGREQWRLRTPDSLARARDLFEQATARDAQFARAWAGLADSWLLQADYGVLPLGRAIEQAEAHAVRAVTLAPRLGEAWASLGLLRMMAGQFDGARRSLEEAMRLDPRYEMAPMWLAAVYKGEGRAAEARRVLEQALELNPLEPVINFNLAESLASAGELDQARSLLQRALAVRADEALLLRGLAMVEARAGDFARAHEAARRALKQDPDAPANILSMAEIELQLERYDAAQALVERLPDANEARVELSQWLRMRRGEAGFAPGFAEAVGEAVQTPQSLSPKQRKLLVMAAMGRIMAEDAQAATRLLELAVQGYQEGSREPMLFTALSLLARLQQAAGSGEADALRQRLLGQEHEWISAAGSPAERAYTRAMLALMRGASDAAVAALEEAVGHGFLDRWVLAYDPRLDPLRADPRLVALERRVAERLDTARGRIAGAA